MLIIGISSLQLTEQERSFLQHPCVAGVILFARNFASKDQLSDLCSEIRQSAPRPQLICVDQEGGRVQRFKEGYFGLPSLERIGASQQNNLRDALQIAEQHAFLMASEVMASGLDLSFAPVADLGRGNLAIGNRAFASQPKIVCDFIEAYVHGMHRAGMAATLKHFPGHGSVLEDTHFDDAVDDRSYAEISTLDMLPFKKGILSGAEAVMMAHVRYPQVAEQPAGYSNYWIHDVLKVQLGFNGLVISDDIGMAAAESVGGVAARIKLHLNAGCDLVLACPPALVASALDAMPHHDYSVDKFNRLRAKNPKTWDELTTDHHYQRAIDAMNNLEQA